MNNNGKNRRNHGIRRFWLIAAVVALMLFLMGSAIAALVTLHVENSQIRTYGGETQNGEKVSFEEVHDVFLELGDYYPQQIPDGYAMTFVSDGAPMGYQRIAYENESGKLIDFWIRAGGSGPEVEVYQIESKTEVEINGLTGILYEQAENQRTVVWADEDLGYGYSLYTDDASVDLLAMAKSTAEGEHLTPTRSESTVKALEELGDYSPDYLPEGYEEYGVLGSPLSEGGDWYSYVRKYYVNKAENTRIYFEYETYVLDAQPGHEYDANVACANRFPGGQETQINGMYALVSENRIAWADPEAHVVYYVFSEDVTGEELLRFAESIHEN